MKTVRQHLGGLALREPICKKDVWSSGLTVDHWTSIMKAVEDGGQVDEDDTYSRIYFGGIAPEVKENKYRKKFMRNVDVS